MHTTKEMEDPQVVKLHNHIPDAAAVGISARTHSMKRHAESSRNELNHIFTFTSATVANEVKARMPSADTCKHVLRRARAKHQPPDLRTLQDLIISNEWCLIVGDNPETFLLYDNRVDAEEHMVIFSTKETPQHTRCI